MSELKIIIIKKELLSTLIRLARAHIPLVKQYPDDTFILDSKDNGMIVLQKKTVIGQPRSIKRT